jgi:hypothetical protein
MPTVTVTSWRRSSTLRALRDFFRRRQPEERPTRTITITSWRRPFYLRQVIESLRQNDTTGYTLYVALEPGGLPETLNVARSAAEFVDTRILVNSRNLGVRENPFNLLTYVFEHEGSQGNVYLEEDTVVSADALRLVNWYFEKVDKSNLMSLHLFNYESDSEKLHDLFVGKEFNSLGIAMTREQWGRWYRSYWHDDVTTKKVFPDLIGWDWAMRAVLALHEDLATLTPRCVRSNHIGREGGVHCTPEFHDERFASLRINEDPDVSHYRIEPLARISHRLATRPGEICGLDPGEFAKPPLG